MLEIMIPVFKPFTARPREWLWDCEFLHASLLQNIEISYRTFTVFRLKKNLPKITVRKQKCLPQTNTSQHRHKTNTRAGKGKERRRGGPNRHPPPPPPHPRLFGTKNKN
jgi:hypothetical protein